MSKERYKNQERFIHVLRYLMLLMALLMIVFARQDSEDLRVVSMDDVVSAPIVDDDFYEGDFLESLSVLSSLFLPNDPALNEQTQLYSTNPENNWVFSDWRIVYEWTQTFIDLREILFSEDNPPEEMIVAVLDSGVSNVHEDLLPGIFFVNESDPINGIDDDGNGYIDDYDKGIDLVSNDSDATNDVHNHGTGVAGIIAEETDNNIGGAGKLPGLPVKILPIRVLDHEGNGSVGDVVEALEYIIDLIDAGNNIRVVNMSFGGSYNGSPETHQLFAELASRGVIVIAAVGNGNNPEFDWPANEPDVIAVMASDTHGCPNPSTNYPPGTPESRTVMTFGSSTYLISSLAPDGYHRASGTSFSAPMVAQFVSFLLTIDTTLTSPEIIQIIRDTSQMVEGCNKPGGNSVGVVSFPRGVGEVLGTTPTNTPTVTPWPTVTPQPIETPIPTLTPVPTSTLTPTAIPTSTPQPTLTVTPVFPPPEVTYKFFLPIVINLN